ncbi:hypothetical protein JI721_09780 [Alicyclobacillus cycloheptanicus]|uniref:Heme/copper-type cytochrome/quinol oxidase subunit 3 n=1 Tax=Alicyclobacillus cycloheptanicus TaxID=1457 RepID=A0ABT9XJ11_9BACL|nr:hypothetical protein [Alicyclobacillus cycloheptanicus]MDQ0190301.1 heme/copper-type cytochrome/quinol oxidase subunit 3 [Alicyclobacillus cycloheptanicus]WDM00051.1 hypothetical protein JI721_09780 [Alicyclobacillus cycloheptanicus]
MSVHDAHGHINHEENIDRQGNLVLAMWLGLVAVTFTAASFVASNVYLRKWSPTKFTLPHSAILKDLPYWSTLMLLIAGILCLIAGALFAKNQWKAFNLVLAITTLAFVAVVCIDFRLFVWFANSSPQTRTIYAPTAFIELGVSVTSVVLLAFAGWYASYGNKARINYFFPAAMNWWLYNAMFGIVVLLMENVITVGSFAAWCGQHLT